MSKQSNPARGQWTGIAASPVPRPHPRRLRRLASAARRTRGIGLPGQLHPAPARQEWPDGARLHQAGRELVELHRASVRIGDAVARQGGQAREPLARGSADAGRSPLPGGLRRGREGDQDRDDAGARRVATAGGADGSQVDPRRAQRGGDHRAADSNGHDHSGASRPTRRSRWEKPPSREKSKTRSRTGGSPPSSTSASASAASRASAPGVRCRPPSTIGASSSPIAWPSCAGPSRRTDQGRARQEPRRYWTTIFARRTCCGSALHALLAEALAHQPDLVVVAPGRERTGELRRLGHHAGDRRRAIATILESREVGV